MIVKKGTFTCHFMLSDTEKQFPNLEAALAAAENYVGNRSFSKPFPHEEMYLFGPGDGTTTVMVREDFDIK